MLRWALQHGAAVIPRSGKRAHMAASLDLEGFELSAAQMAEIDALDGTDARAVRVPPSPPKLCADQDAGCEKWVRLSALPLPPTTAPSNHRHRTNQPPAPHRAQADAGECETNPSFMHQACAGSCGTCDERKVEL